MEAVATDTPVIIEMQHTKRSLGQYFTRGNPFMYRAFQDWLSAIHDTDSVFLEPFVGNGDIPDMLNGIGVRAQWVCYDTDTTCVRRARENGYTAHHQDTLKHFPKGYRVAITNPPYLAKNSASRRKIPYPATSYDDVYKMALDEMLAAVDFVAAIIPESFLTQNIFHSRLHSVVSIPTLIFDDTECPVCLAMFSPLGLAHGERFLIYSGDTYLGTYQDMMWSADVIIPNEKWVFNDKDGILGLHAVDNNQCDSIYFLRGEHIAASSIKISSRAITRIGSPHLNVHNLDTFIAHINALIPQYRSSTKDVFMTPFKGLRKDGVYRRRMDFKTARMLLNESLHSFTKNGNYTGMSPLPQSTF